jgi:hypothetical protein
VVVIDEHLIPYFEKGCSNMQLTFELKDYKTCSGKQKIAWHCQHCHCMFLDLSGFFYQTALPKGADDLKQSLTIFVDAVNKQTVSELFKKPSTALKLYAQLCQCIPGVVSIEHLQGVKRAKDVLARGLDLIHEQKN